MSNATRTRDQVPASEAWDLSSLYASVDAWEQDLPLLAACKDRMLAYRGRLSEGPATVRAFLELDREAGMLDERLGYYIFLRMSEDAGNSDNQGRQGRYDAVATEVQASASWFAPELLSLSQDQLDRFLASPELAEWKRPLEKIIRNKPHTLSPEEESLLSLQEDAFQTPRKTFDALIDVDFDFGSVETPEGPVPLTHGSFQVLQQHGDPAVRKASFEAYYKQFAAHRNTLASLYTGSIKQDCYKARVRKFKGALERALFPDNVDRAVYENLIQSVRKGLPVLHRYYALRARLAGKEQIDLWDTKTSLVEGVKHFMSYEDACALVLDALAPLGNDYVETLRAGLLGGWVDRYENKGKDSGAFSAGSFKGDPYILLNFKPELVRDVFTLAHEAGHSMHSWHSARHQPFQTYGYTIFEAEIASTFNEQLLFKHWLDKSTDPRHRLYLVNKQIDDLLATLFRQTMFAEFELRCHEKQEAGEALSIDVLRKEYRALQETWFGPSVRIHELADLEGLRIPHFYRAFYVYKYATGVSAAIALSRKVLAGTGGAVEAYKDFLCSGGSAYPLDSVRKAGVDMARPEAVESAIAYFGELIDELEAGLKAVGQA